MRVEPRKGGQVVKVDGFKQEAWTGWEEEHDSDLGRVYEQKLVASELAQALAPQRSARHVAGPAHLRAREAAAREIERIQAQAAVAVDAARARTKQAVEDYRAASTAEAVPRSSAASAA